MSSQQKREIVLQIMYSLEIKEAEDLSLAKLMAEQLKIPRKVAFEALERAKKIRAEQNTFDEQISDTSESYALERIQLVEKNILRIALYETQKEGLPMEVAIKEAIRLARKFSNPESSDYVNAILDAILK